MSVDLETQYDRIYRYCYFKLHSRELAEDVTQETFLRYLEHYDRMPGASALRYLYTIARNLCVDEYRRPGTGELDENRSDGGIEEDLLNTLAVRAALSRLSAEEQELLLLRYVNEVPVCVLSTLYGTSRFAVYRRIRSASNKFREELRKEEFYEELER